MVHRKRNIHDRKRERESDGCPASQPASQLTSVEAAQLSGEQCSAAPVLQSDETDLTWPPLILLMLQPGHAGPGVSPGGEEGADCPAGEEAEEEEGAGRPGAGGRR